MLLSIVGGVEIRAGLAAEVVEDLVEFAGGVVGVGGGASVGRGLLGETDERGVLPDGSVPKALKGTDLAVREGSRKGKAGILANFRV